MEDNIIVLSEEDWVVGEGTPSSVQILRNFRESKRAVFSPNIEKLLQTVEGYVPVRLHRTKENNEGLSPKQFIEGISQMENALIYFHDNPDIGAKIYAVEVRR